MHLFSTILDLDGTEIKVLSRLRFKRIPKLMHLNQTELDLNFNNSKDSESSTYNTFRRWMWYCTVNDTTIDDFGHMDNTVWEDVNTNKLEGEYNRLTSTSSFAGSPPTSMTTANFSSTYISSSLPGYINNLPPVRTSSNGVLCISFLKDTEVKL